MVAAERVSEGGVASVDLPLRPPAADRQTVGPLRKPGAAPRAEVAQLVEHGSEKPGVGGSIPPLGTVDLISKLAAMSPRKTLNDTHYPNAYPNPVGTRGHLGP